MADPGRLFDVRLGLALGKTQEEIRKMPAPDYRDFELLYLLEPWGWQNKEFLFGKLMSVVAAFSGRAKKGVSAKDFMREDIGGIKGELSVEAMLADKTPEEIKEIKKSRIKQIFGIFK